MRCPNCEAPLSPLDPPSSTASPYVAHACAECRCTVVTSSTGPAWSFPFLKVLVVDSDPESRETLRRMLEQLGCQVATEPSLEAGIERAFGDRPEVVFWGLESAGSPMDALAGLRHLKTDVRTRLVTLVACTSDPSPSRALDAVEAGAADALSKPFRRSQVIDLLVRHFSAPVASGRG